jgi:hypothetical protein
LSNNGTANGVSGLKAAGYGHRGRPAAGAIMSTRLSWRAGVARASAASGNVCPSTMREAVTRGVQSWRSVPLGMLLQLA